MAHWHTQESLARQHREDLDREAVRASRVAEAKASSTASAPTAPAELTPTRATDWLRARAAHVVSIAALRARFVR